MPEDKTIELYRILKEASPKGDFSKYESVIRDYEVNLIADCIASLKLKSKESTNFLFFEPKKDEKIEVLYGQTERYIESLNELKNQCANCIINGCDIGNLDITGLYANGKLDLSSIEKVELVINRLKTAKGKANGGIYFSESPLCIFIKPALNTDNRVYAEEFNKHLDDFIADRSVKTSSVQDYFQKNNYTYVSESTVKFIEVDANKNLTATIAEFTRTSSRKLAWSMLWRTILVFALLATPTFILSIKDVRFTEFDWYWWIFYILFGAAAGIVPQFIFGTIKVRVYRIEGNINLNMFMVPFAISCILLVLVMAPIAIYNGLLSIIFAAIYFVLYVVGTLVKYHLNSSSNCNSANAWGMRNIISGLVVCLVSFCFGNLLLDNLAAHLTVNILSALACLATCFAGEAFTDFIDDLEDEFTMVISIVLPITAFVVGQVVQYSLYDAGNKVLIVGDIFGEIPLFFMVISSICCTLCTAVICTNNFMLVDNDNKVRCWISNIVCSACFAIIPCFSGAVGIVALPVLTYMLARHYNDDDESFFALGVIMLVLYYVIGQIVQYYFYIVGDSDLALAVLLSRIPLWLQIISTIASAISLGLTIRYYAEYYDEEGSRMAIFIPGILLGALPAVMGIPLMVVMIILVVQMENSVDEEYQPIAPMITAFVVGQVLMWWNFVETGELFFLSDLLRAFGYIEPIGFIFPIISSVFGLATCIMSIILVYWYFEEGGYYGGDELVNMGLWILTPFSILMVIAPVVASIPLFVVVLISTIFNAITRHAKSWKESDAKRREKIAICLTMCIVIVLHAVFLTMSFIELTHVGKYSYNGIYYEEKNGKYYVADCEEDKGILVVPKVIKGHEVAGMTYEFKSKHSGPIYNLHYEYADAGDEASMVIVLKSNTKEIFPIPRREGYSFYGWWTSSNRYKGNAITDSSGRLRQYTSSTGTSDVYAMWYGSDYIFISSIDEVRNNLSGKYVLTKDIEIKGNFVPICGLSGMETQSYREAFNGVLDGNYHTIKYSITGSRRYNGLFSWIGQNGVVKNLGVDVDIDVDFNPTRSDYYAFAGGIAAINDGTIRNCWSSGSIKLKNTTSVAFAAGIAGASGTADMRSGAITGCYNLASIESVADDSYSAGILGSAENDGQTVSYCYNRGTLKATGRNSNNTAAGGIISHGRTYAKNCYNAGAVLTDYHEKQTLGGILGFIRNTYSHNCPPENCAWMKASNCQAQWGVGKYPNDSTGGNNKGVTVVTKEDSKLIYILNKGSKQFVLSEGQLRLAWESFLIN